MVMSGLWCAKSGILSSIKIIKTLINILCILAPSAVVVTSMVSFFKCVVDDSKTKDAVIKLIEKVFIAAFIIFIPTIITTVISFIGNGSYKDNFSDCWNNATSSQIAYYKKLEAAESAAKESEKKIKAEEAKEEAQKQREKEKENYKDANQNNGSGNVGSVKNSNVDIIYIGDSRTVGIYYTLNGGYSNEVNTSSGNEYWLAKVSMGYNWFTSTAVPYIKGILNNKDCTVTIQMGTNDLYNSGLARSYVTQIKGLAAAYPKSDFVIISVNPIDDTKAKNHGYTVSNSEAIAFNNVFRSEISQTGYNNISYCDVYSKIINNYNATDGIHFDGNTNKTIYSHIQECI